MKQRQTLGQLSLVIQKCLLERPEMCDVPVFTNKTVRVCHTSTQTSTGLDAGCMSFWISNEWKDHERKPWRRKKK